MEKRFITEALVRNRGRRMVTAAELGIDKGTLRRKIGPERIQTVVGAGYRLVDPAAEHLSASD